MEDTFNTNPKMVLSNNNEGKTEKSVARAVNNTINNTTKLNVRFSAIKKSSSTVGSGMINISTMRMTVNATAISILYFFAAMIIFYKIPVFCC